MIVWVDVESTALDESEGHLLEVAMVATDDELIERTYASVVIKPVGINIEDVKMPLIVREMHEKNGLLRDVANGFELGEGELNLIHWLKTDFGEIEGLRKIPLAGSTIAFDRRWLRRHMPELHALFSYRSIDVSALTELAMRWAPAIYNDRPKPEKGAPHRALDDVRASVALLRYYKEKEFVGV
jgi:oligoribonuclease